MHCCVTQTQTTRHLHQLPVEFCRWFEPPTAVHRIAQTDVNLPTDNKLSAKFQAQPSPFNSPQPNTRLPKRYPQRPSRKWNIRNSNPSIRTRARSVQKVGAKVSTHAVHSEHTANHSRFSVNVLRCRVRSRTASQWHRQSDTLLSKCCHGPDR